MASENRVLRTIFWPRGRKWQEAGKNHIMRSFIISRFTLHQMLLGWSNQEGWEGSSMWHACVRILVCKTSWSTKWAFVNFSSSFLFVKPNIAVTDNLLTKKQCQTSHWRSSNQKINEKGIVVSKEPQFPNAFFVNLYFSVVLMFIYCRFVSVSSLLSSCPSCAKSCDKNERQVSAVEQKGFMQSVNTWHSVKYQDIV
jgi:hypothetical protein